MIAAKSINYRQETDMRRAHAALLLLFIGGVSPLPDALAAANVVRYSIASNSTAVAKVSFLGLGSKSARFDAISGQVSFSPSNLKTLNITVAIDASQLKAGDKTTLKRLKSKDFFWVEKYPTVTFIGKSLTMKTATTGTVSGDLTARGTTKPVSMAVTFSAPPAQANGTERVTLNGQTTINRNDFGMTAYPAIVGKKVKITLNAKLVAA